MEQLDDATGTDSDVDVTDWWAVSSFVENHDPTLIYHLAGAKHAPEGEQDPSHIAHVNIIGTANIIDMGIPTVLASTCKAADPETAYGASKLIAERIVLNAGGWIARFYNVVETSGNVFTIWANTPTSQPLPVMDCWRYFISLEDAIYLIRLLPELPPGRYTIPPGEPVYIPELAARLYPDRDLIEVPRRRGDRYREPLHATSETIDDAGAVWRIESPHDPC